RDSESNDWVETYRTSYNYSEQDISNVNENVDGIYKVYPNPGSGNITISFTGNLSHTIFELFDLHGRKIISREINNNECINLEKLNSGIYLYNLYPDSIKLSGRLIIK
ncbi:MAG: T9SS type A sorting domain-containing protein, partial [Prolixibacteraceae bacterium]|nr:T9SS type A sorting domain-containing protein [Prolixibacteraceae bacterium]